ncbi:hypothetical protein AAF712_001088 [Marasmius tenuissimus]|uniref:Uncharacterized protein n=1 Tax=Marasmius tenuissimus TaxID=585030 RepID=A0ABR3AE31_9AGAR
MDAIFDKLSITDLAHFARTCKLAKTETERYYQSGFSVNKLLLPYFTYDEIQDFRMVQAYTGALISGSTALQYFERTRYKDSDLDVYVEYRHAKVLADFLESAGYIFKPKESQRQDLTLASALEGTDDENECEYGPGLKGIQGIFSLTKGERNIQIITAKDSTMEVIFNFHCTVVMNVISYSHAYCMFPKATLEQRTGLVCVSANEEEERDKARNKYLERGWKLINYDGKEWGHSPTPPPRGVSESESELDWSVDRPTSTLSDGQRDAFRVDRLRHLGDSYCFTIRLKEIPGYHSATSISDPSVPVYKNPPAHVREELDPHSGYRSLEINSWTLSDAEVYDPAPITKDDGDNDNDNDDSDNDKDEDDEDDQYEEPKYLPSRGFPLAGLSGTIGRVDKDGGDYRMVYNLQSHRQFDYLRLKVCERLRFGYCIGLELLDREVNESRPDTLLDNARAALSSRSIARELKNLDVYPMYARMKRSVAEEDELLDGMKGCGFIPGGLMITRADGMRDAILVCEEYFDSQRYDKKLWDTVKRYFAQM